MALSWNEIKDRAVKFTKEWKDTTNEEADAKPFLDAFFDVFGITRKKIGTFEHRVKKLSDADGYIDLLWKGNILIEMKSRGKNLDKAFQQAIDYTHGLKQNELPKYVLVCDFYIFRLYDTEEQTTLEFTIDELIQNVQSFGYLLGYQKKTFKEQDPANIKAAELMGKLHDRLEEIGYEGHPLEVYLVRILFCLFAEDTTIFEKQQFQDYIENRTAEDGSDLASKVQELFQVLNTAKDKRFKNLDEQLNDFPYVNGKLFEEILPMASFDSKMRQALLDCCYIDWSKISPAIFGSMFQSVMNPKERRNLGAHYTSESNILKLIKPLFLDELWTEFESLKGNKNKLPEFHKKISQLKFLDPACGCGNFLVITYRELRLLELEVLRATYKSGQGVLDVSDIIWLDVDMMCGIEYEEFPARIAEVAMWLIDHQMNMLVSDKFGEYIPLIPLQKSAVIVNDNSLKIDWQSIVKPLEGELGPARYNYILGNPPFLGKQFQGNEQRADMELVFNGVHGYGILDYVACWYIKAASYLFNYSQDHFTRVAFVSTNSITQGEQVGVLWNELYSKYKIKIHFAHKTFKWSNEAKGNAAVHVVIIGFSNYESSRIQLYEYLDDSKEPINTFVSNINPYLLEGNDTLIQRRTSPICKVPKLGKGNQPTDGGHLLMNEEERDNLIGLYPHLKPFIKLFLGSQELIQGIKKYCLWLVDVSPTLIISIPEITKRLELVRQMRMASTDKNTRKMAETPTLFRETHNYDSFLAIPVISSERRRYIPIAFLGKETIPSNNLQILPNADIFHFGVLTSIMHMSWMKYTAGRFKSDYIYSNSITYNNYPWPETPTVKQRQTVEEAAQNVIDARAQFPDSSLSDLYDPNTMPPFLVKAHQALDKAVDLCYRSQPFTTEAKRIEYLFELYEKYTAGMFAEEKPNKVKKLKSDL